MSTVIWRVLYGVNCVNVGYILCGAADLLLLNSQALTLWARWNIVFHSHLFIWILTSVCLADNAHDTSRFIGTAIEHQCSLINDELVLEWRSQFSTVMTSAEIIWWLSVVFSLCVFSRSSEAVSVDSISRQLKWQWGECVPCYRMWLTGISMYQMCSTDRPATYYVTQLL